MTRRNLEHQIYPSLLNGLKINRVNQVSGIDITYIRLQAGWLYLVAVLDWHSRYLLSWQLEISLEMGFVESAVNKSLKQATPEICNSEQGSHFTSRWDLERLQSEKIPISLDWKGRALDNIFTERLWRTVKDEKVYLKEYETPRIAREGLKQ